MERVYVKNSKRGQNKVIGGPFYLVLDLKAKVAIPPPLEGLIL